MRHEMTVALGEVGAAVAALVLAVLSWNRGIVTTAFAPLGEVPGFEATRYNAPWLVLAAFLVAVAGLLGIDAVTRALRSAAKK
ncbi:hypothetical protein SAMN04244553_2858 [Nocardia amikacinitolerans]|uniref:Uncharacterized protein n=1 Tax=Nocardia amikacinitolerans TaxID=756689 RepID=A0A285L8I7_9NOCA|nr:hypothetical protein [Nocardia amikacinitolerans]SNY81270.1 hypothetical protein SAMN04244553_2858 [Nocardia amikacinitolerans]